jgi:hypothetical protein
MNRRRKLLRLPGENNLPQAALNYIFDRYDPTVESSMAALYISKMIGGEILLTFDKFATSQVESIDLRTELHTLMNEQSDSNFATERVYNIKRYNRASILLAFTFSDVGQLKGIYPQLINQ